MDFYGYKSQCNDQFNILGERKKREREITQKIGKDYQSC